MFSTFEEWMYASEFGKAANQQIEINEAIETLNAKETPIYCKELLDIINLE